MSDHELPELAPELRRLLAAARPGPDVPQADQEHLCRALDAIIGKCDPYQPPPTTPTQSDSGGPAPGGLLHFVQSKAAIGAAGLVLGAALGVGGHALFVAGNRAAPSASPTPALSGTSPLPSPSLLDTVTTNLARAASAAPSLAPDIPSAQAIASSPLNDTTQERNNSRDVELNAERALIDVARAALARGQAASAIETLTRHAQSYPRGRLVEEREALWVRALLMSGQQGQAQPRAQQFRKNYPSSLLLPPIPSASTTPDP